MRLPIALSALMSSLLLAGCVNKGTNPIDPYEPVNREIHKFNMAFDATMLKPPAKLYKAVVPAPVRVSINNAYNNVFMIPTVASDLLQADWHYAIKDTWRFLINSTLGIGGLFDVADKSFSLPPHYNDLGLTFAKWGDKKSPYIVIPLLGPSTIRDGVALPFDYLLTPYPYLASGLAIYSLSGVRYVDLRSQLLDNESILNEAFDKYSLIRDAYLQRRDFLITGKQQDTNASLYLDEQDVVDYVDDVEPAKAKIPVESKTKDVAHSPVSTRNPT